MEVLCTTYHVRPKWPNMCDQAMFVRFAAAGGVPWMLFSSIPRPGIDAPESLFGLALGGRKQLSTEDSGRSHPPQRNHSTSPRETQPRHRLPRSEEEKPTHSGWLGAVCRCRPMLLKRDAQ